MKSTTTAAQPRSEKGRTVSGKAPSTASTASNEAQVRERAYECWEEAGCPAGDGVEFWLKAEAELALETGPRGTDDEPRSPSK
jgi:hypothetical protein